MNDRLQYLHTCMYPPKINIRIDLSVLHYCKQSSLSIYFFCNFFRKFLIICEKNNHVAWCSDAGGVWMIVVFKCYIPPPSLNSEKNILKKKKIGTSVAFRLIYQKVPVWYTC